MAEPLSSNLYRKTNLGKCLVRALHQLVVEEKIPGYLGLKILEQFDQIIANFLEEKVTAKSTLKGKLLTYKYVDSVWTFVLDEALLSMAPSMSCSKKDEEEVKVECMDEEEREKEGAGPKEGEGESGGPASSTQPKRKKKYDERKLLKLVLVDKSLVTVTVDNEKKK